jgi:hypothetical protein
MIAPLMKRTALLDDVVEGVSCQTKSIDILVDIIVHLMMSIGTEAERQSIRAGLMLKETQSWRRER